MNDLVQTMFDCKARVGDSAKDLQRLAHAFDITGNARAAEQLYSIADDVIQAAEEMCKAWSDDLHSQVAGMWEDNWKTLGFLLEKPASPGQEKTSDA